jgi:hypothetical protein
MARLFISQKRLDEWVEKQRVELEGNEMTLVDDGRRFSLAEGVCFAEVVGGDEDPNDLLGRVKTKAQLDEMGAEHFPGSVIIGEVGYEVRDGFVGEPA